MTSKFISAAQRYVALSNAHDLKGCWAMFSKNATYSSAGLGKSFSGIAEIQKMMSDFFAARPDIKWDVKKYYIRDEKKPHIVTFDFLAQHTEDDTVCDSNFV